MSINAVHVEQAIKAIEKGYQVLCEKPLSINIDISVVDAHKKALRTHPNQKVICAFSRRFDASYREAYQKMFVEYAKTSGGIFLDCSIHDIDLMLRFIGENYKLKSVQAVGVTTVYHRLDSTKDHDSETATIEFQGGRAATLYCSRMMTAGQEDTTEIICERSSLKVNMQGRKNHVEVYDLDSARRELPQHYYERFREAFATEASEFTDCCLDNKPTRVPL
ncbi:uncharacterized protein ASPGLDRAFT_40543 [Aspergillus glaucus CBS 516.65]|uniref:GFO/IDH/MocA-like oxidoreductase domain-containing protein n=1 Tax=Aspergillus glaucus CBS 516.65 TaxID=1160497 RepID=A0A1L9V4D7_ASPGL|nr:hypothetical protein ASPGLDRAFT_40543 [Aspergillus glaucus CBS 516.65]OJJ78766.1 hypothetical protein ASPGLDRAFT_40543 [Aspergillus glaucus CBS 516.65]